jgi:glucokinase
MGIESIYAALDIGGTKVAAGLVNGRGEILFQTRVPMLARGSCDEAFACVEKALKLVLAEGGAPVSAIGISAPGPLDPKTGVILNPPNMPCWRNFPLAARVREEFGLPVVVENDANAAALAEFMWGAGAGYKIVFYTTIGTGIGTGLVLDGRIYNGRTGLAPEGAHIPLDWKNGMQCGCGKRGCIEGSAAGPAIAKRARAKIAEFPERGKALLELAGGDVERVSAEMVADAWRAGDALATETLRDTVELITVWLGAIVDLLEPEVIVVGGGVGELVSQWFPEMREMLPRWTMNPRVGEIPLRLAKYEADAGIAGAGALCVGEVRSEK